MLPDRLLPAGGEVKHQRNEVKTWKQLHCAGSSLPEMKKNIQEAIEGHIEISLEYNYPLPDIFKGEYELEFGLTTEALLIAYNDIFTKAALSRITGINQRQLLPSFSLK